MERERQEYRQAREDEERRRQEKEYQRQVEEQQRAYEEQLRQYYERYPTNEPTTTMMTMTTTPLSSTVAYELWPLEGNRGVDGLYHSMKPVMDEQERQRQQYEYELFTRNEDDPITRIEVTAKVYKTSRQTGNTYSSVYHYDAPDVSADRWLFKVLQYAERGPHRRMRHTRARFRRKLLAKYYNSTTNSICSEYLKFYYSFLNVLLRSKAHYSSR